MIINGESGPSLSPPCEGGARGGGDARLGDGEWVSLS